ncbi:MAG: aldehyde dehydrogenase [Betaproteobacteria bacterium RIFCSPLOWO2_02_FULL_66_14]|nr:MAG: aldehyde dehydrogenase [Betaproteobacteria bacterium RIFCSPLOWO2_02_FULL_66_14]
MKAVLRRREVVRELLEERGELLVVAGLGSAAWDCTAAGDSDLTFPLWGAMGVASVTGLGLALAQPGRRVLVITGDGEMLMGLGNLATIGVQKPRNLAVAVIDNERYGETGMQSTHTAQGVDLAAVAKACGFGDARVVWRKSGLKAAVRALRASPGPVLVQFKVVAEKLPLVLPPRDGSLLRSRFRRALHGSDADSE